MIKEESRMEKPNISEKFTVEDIHAIREYHSKKREKLTLEERLLEIKKKADACEKDIDEYRKNELAI